MGQTSHKPSTAAAQPLSLFAFLPSKVSPQCLGNVCRSHAQRHTVHLLLLHADLVVRMLWDRGTLWLIQTRAKNRQHPSSPATLLIETSAINKHTINTDFVNHTANSIAQTRAYQLKKTVSVKLAASFLSLCSHNEIGTSQETTHGTQCSHAQVDHSV